MSALKLSTGLQLAALGPEHRRHHSGDDDKRHPKIDCIHRLWLACRKMGGHTLPDLSRSQADAKLIATATNVNDQNQADSGTKNPRQPIASRDGDSRHHADRALPTSPATRPGNTRSE